MVACNLKEQRGWYENDTIGRPTLSVYLAINMDFEQCKLKSSRLGHRATPATGKVLVEPEGCIEALTLYPARKEEQASDLKEKTRSAWAALRIGGHLCPVPA
jgi:hypothetical protein